MSYGNVPTPATTGLGYYFQFREPSAFARGFLRDWWELPEKVRLRGASVCPRATFTAGRLSHSGSWRIATVFVPHEAVPFGEAEAGEFAARILAAVEGASA